MRALFLFFLMSAASASSKLAITPVNPKQLTNSALQFNVTANGKSFAGRVQWSSSDPAIARIDSSGNASLLSAGTTIINAAVGQNQHASTVLTVTTAEPPIFAVQPKDTSVNALINSPAGVKVRLIDNLGGPLPGQPISMSIHSNPPAALSPSFGSGALSGTLIQVTDSSGIAVFPDLRIDWLGSGYSLDATANPSSGEVVSTSEVFNELGVGDPCLWAGARTQTCSLITPCADSDSDGLPDAWEKAGGLDLKGDGHIAPVLTNVDPLLPDGTPNPSPSADPNAKDVFVKYDWMELPDQLTNGQPTTCTRNKLPSPYNILLPHHSDACNFDQLCLPPSDVAAACDSTADNCTCKGHTDEPTRTGLKLVIDAYAARGVRLHIIRGHGVAHANVTHYGPTPAACIQEFSSLSFEGAQAVNFYDIKSANFNANYNGQTFSEQELSPVFHYVLFAHRHTCDSIDDCNNTLCDPVRPQFNETGRSWKPGNDMIVSMGGLFDRTAAYLPDLGQGGTFMHELGHNLGLDHGGPLNVNGVPSDSAQVSLNFKPNFISVMNYDFQTIGISSADPGCAPDDALCRTTAIRTRLDYSSFCPLGQTACDPTQLNVPNTLDETNGTEAAGINIGNNDISYAWSPLQTPIPATGPVDLNGDGNDTDTWCANGCTFPAIDLNNDGAPVNMLQPFEDWPNLSYRFQCSTIFSSGGGDPGFSSRLTGNAFSQEITTDEILDRHVAFPPLTIPVEILPNADSRLVTIAIHGGRDLNVNEIEASTFTLFGAQALFATIEDFDGDGYADLLLTFEERAINQRRRMQLRGWLKSGQLIFGDQRARSDRR